MTDYTFFEREYAAKGLYMAGADEAGRGPLAGPVVAAAVIMPADYIIEGVKDSKKIKSEKKREELYALITAKAIAWRAAVVPVEVIEKVNILEATRIAFNEAINGLEVVPAHVFTDALDKLTIPYEYTPVIKGDDKIYTISAASIIAKVTRDRIMNELDAVYPEYGFAKHKGYGTKQHYDAIRLYGTCKEHRQSFLRKFYESL